MFAKWATDIIIIVVVVVIIIVIIMLFQNGSYGKVGDVQVILTFPNQNARIAIRSQGKRSDGTIGTITHEILYKNGGPWTMQSCLTLKSIFKNRIHVIQYTVQ